MTEAEGRDIELMKHCVICGDDIATELGEKFVNNRAVPLGRRMTLG